MSPVFLQVLHLADDKMPGDACGTSREKAFG